MGIAALNPSYASFETQTDPTGAPWAPWKPSTAKTGLNQESDEGGDVIRLKKLWSVPGFEAVDDACGRKEPPHWFYG